MSFELPTIEREIDGVRFKITKLPFKRSRATLLLLGKKVFPALRKAAEGVNFADALGTTSDRKAKIVTQIAPKMIDALADLFEHLDAADLEKLDEAFGSHSSFENGADAHGEPRWASLSRDENRELVFGASMSRYAKWLLACMEVTYADFFAGLRARSGPSS